MLRSIILRLSLPEVSTLTRSLDCGCANLWDDQTIIWAGFDDTANNKDLYMWDYTSDNPIWVQHESTFRIGRPLFRNLDNSTVIVAPRNQRLIRRFTIADELIYRFTNNCLASIMHCSKILEHISFQDLLFYINIFLKTQMTSKM